MIINNLSKGKLARRSAALVLGLSITATTFAFTAPAASAASYVGGIDMQAACREQHGLGFLAYNLVGGAYNWFCVWYTQVKTGGQHLSIDVNKYCRDTFGPSAYADPQGGGAYDWGCYAVNR